MIIKKQVLKTFIQLVTIDSPSGEEKKVGDYIVRYLKKIKIKAVRDSYGNLIAKVPGTGAPLLLSAHMDTVEPGKGIKPMVKGNIIKTNGTTILGADDKAGITGILEAASYLKKKKIKHRPLELIFTREEEVGLKGAANLNYKKVKAKEGLVIDSDKPLGHITLAAPFIYKIDIRIKGRGAHAGAEPEKGINAIQIAAKAMSEFKIGRINKSTTNNIGVIQGGSVVNSVPAEVTIKAEARSHDIKLAQEQVDIMNKAFKKHVRRFKARLYFKAKLECYGYKHLRNDSFIKTIAQVNKRLGNKVVYYASGGAGDANVMAGKKIKAVVISYGGANCHTTKEIARISELVKATKFLVEFVKV